MGASETDLILRVRGNATTKRDPDEVVVHLNASKEGASRNEVVEAVTSLQRALTDELEGREDITFAADSLSVNTWQPTDRDGRPLPERHSANAAIRIRYTDTTHLDRDINAFALRDGLQLNYISWELSDAARREAEAELLRDALAHARSRANVLAAAEGAGDAVVIEVADEGLLSGESTTTHFEAAASARSFGAGDQSMKMKAEPLTLRLTVNIRAVAKRN